MEGTRYRGGWGGAAGAEGERGQRRYRHWETRCGVMPAAAEGPQAGDQRRDLLRTAVMGNQN